MRYIALLRAVNVGGCKLPMAELREGCAELGWQQVATYIQSGNVVFGIEGDMQGSTADDRFANYKFSNPWFGTVRGRIGYAFNNVLIYGTGGLAFGSLETESLITGLQQSKTSAGYAVGVGAEVGIYQNWTAKIEYLYVNLSANDYTLTSARNGLDFGTVRLGVNYHF